jgi:nitroreductase
MTLSRKRIPARSASAGTVPAPQPPPIGLPKPALARSSPIARAYQQRKTIREMSDRKLPLQMLSNLLWAAWGVNRAKGPFGIAGRTAASASNSQEIDLYVALAEGTYVYDAPDHRLIPVAAGDLRALAIGRGQSKFGAAAPVRLVFVADVDRLAHTAGFQEPGLRDPDVQRSYYHVDAGLIAGNVYLFAAAYGLACWFHNCDRAGLAALLKLRPGQRVLFGQTVGYPAAHQRRGAK